MLNVKFNKKQKTLNESLQASGQFLLLEGVKDELLQPLLDKYQGSVNDLEVLQGLGEWPEITPGPKKPNVKGLSGPEKAEVFREYNRLRKETGEKNRINQEERNRKVKLIRWASLMYGEGPKDHPPREALPVVHEFLNKLPIMRDKYKNNKDFKKKVDELGSGTSNDPLDINQFKSDNMTEIIEAIEGKVGDIQGDSEQAQKDKIGETENWEVFMPSTMASSCALGKGTTWCTARTRGDNLFYNYTGGGTVLFYVIKKNAGRPPSKYPTDYLSLGYEDDGTKIEEYEYGGVNIDSDNRGVTPEEFASIVGEQESKEVYNIIDKKFETFREHPSEEKFRMAISDVEAFNSLFTKGMSTGVALSTMRRVVGYGPYKNNLSPKVKKAIDDKIVKILKSSKNKEEVVGQLYGFDLQGLNLQGINLQGVKIGGLDIRGANLQGANLQGVRSDRVKLQGADLQGADLQGTMFRRVSFRGANLQGANLQGAKLLSCYLQDVNFRGANLQGANFRGANLQGAKYNSETKFPEGFNPEEHGMINTDAKQSNQDQQQQQQELREFKEFLKDRRMI